MIEDIVIIIKILTVIVAMAASSLFICREMTKLSDENRRLSAVVWEQKQILKAEGINFVSKYELKEN